MKTEENLAREIRELVKKIESLEEISGSSIDQMSTDSDGPDSLSQIMKQINAVQNLVDQLEIEIDKLEMRVSAIEHMDFRHRTSGL